jgi:hypothetical protein
VEEEKRRLKNEEEMKLENLKKKLKEQALKDNERIEYRKELFQKKKTDYEQKKIDKQKDFDLKQEKVKKFLDTVKPKVESDPARMVSYTLAEYSRRGVPIHDYKKSNNKEIIEQEQEQEQEAFKDRKQLYNVYGFTDKQISGDARVRIEQRLRQAGLINNNYARELISKVNPPTMPRLDIFSNKCWNGFVLEEKK